MITEIQKSKFLSMSLIKVTALTVSCMVSLPSFAQVCNTADPTCIEPLPNNSANPPDNNTPWWWGGIGGGSTANNPHPWSNQCSGIGCDSASDDPGGYDSQGKVCVSKQELANNVEVCVAATLGAGYGAATIVQGGSCETCFVAPNLISCGVCAAATILTGSAFYLAAQSCKPPEMEVCQ